MMIQTAIGYIQSNQMKDLATLRPFRQRNQLKQKLKNDKTLLEKCAVLYITKIFRFRDLRSTVIETFHQSSLPKSTLRDPKDGTF